VCASEGDLCYPLHNAPNPMTDPKNTEDQELSLDQLKAAAGGSKYINDAGRQGSLKQTGTSVAFNVMGSGVPVETISCEDGDIRKSNIPSSLQPANEFI